MPGPDRRRFEGPVARLREALRPPGFGARTVRVGPWRVRHRVGGEPAAGAPAYVLVHGLIVSGRYLMPLALRLADGARVLVPDLPGFGASDKPRRPLPVAGQAEALAGYLDAAGVERAILVANSFGCQVAAAMLARHPGPVERAVFTGPTIDPAARSAPRQLARLVRSIVHEPVEYPALVAADLARVGLPRAVRSFRLALADRIEEALPRVPVPTLVVRGGRDPIVPRRWAEEATALLPAGELAEIAGGGHALNYGRPDELAALVRAFAEARPGVG